MFTSIRSIVCALFVLAPVVGGCSSAYSGAGAATSPARQLHETARACPAPGDEQARDGSCERFQGAPVEIAARSGVRSLTVMDEPGGGRAAAVAVAPSAAEMRMAHPRRVR